MPLSNILPNLGADLPVGAPSTEKMPSVQGDKDSFANALKESVENVDSLMKAADDKMESLAAGKGENIHEAMIAFEKAETAMKMLVQVRNKAIDAYKTIMQMQV